MSEHAYARATALPRAPAARRLSAEAYGMAGRLAAYLRSALSEVAGPIAKGLEFLEERSLAGHAMRGEPFFGDGSLPLERLVQGFGLSPVERDVLLLAGLAEEHEGFADVFRLLHPSGQSRPTVGLAARLAGDGAGDRAELRVILESGPLVSWNLVAVDGSTPFFSRSVSLAEHLWSALGSCGDWPGGLAADRLRCEPDGLEGWIESSGATRVRAALEQNNAVTVVVSAEREEVAFHRALALVAAAGRRSAAPARTAASPQVLRELALHAWLRDQVPVFVVESREGGDNSSATPDFGGYPGPLVLCARPGVVGGQGGRPMLGVECGRLEPRSVARAWARAVPALERDARAMAARYPVEPYVAHEIGMDLGAVARIEKRVLELTDVAEAVRTRTGTSLDGGIRRLRPKAGFGELVLPKEASAQLREGLDRLFCQAEVFDKWGFLEGRRGARGVRMMFWGPPGTGKSLSAEVLAKELDVDLLVVDLSRVVSKWIGETEKNLGRVFDLAERSCAVLLFDEADALFGKRTEVSDAHDRYANLETAYLLMRLERYEGMAVLSTNFKQNIDPAFLRRLEFVVEFSEPERLERRALWSCHIPPGAPLAEDVDLDRLAALYPASGGMVRNASVAAAFVAASQGREIEQQHFVEALRREYKKSGKAFPASIAGDGL